MLINVIKNLFGKEIRHTFQIRDGKLIVTRVYNLDPDEILLLRQREHNMSKDEFDMLCKL